jgi:hypothetical protein
LAAPAFYTDAKYAKFFKQWDQRLGLEVLKLKHASEGGDMNDTAVNLRHKKEIQDFIAKADESNAALEMQDVYITDHKPVTQKLLTHNESEDEAFYKYKQSLA